MNNINYPKFLRTETPRPPYGCDHGTMINQNLPFFLGIETRIDLDLPSDIIEVWQEGERIGRIEGIGKATS
jgi:hypothetical protein